MANLEPRTRPRHNRPLLVLNGRPARWKLLFYFGLTDSSCESMQITLLDDSVLELDNPLVMIARRPSGRKVYYVTEAVPN